MSLSNKLENAYLSILRYVILAVASLSLIVVVIAAGMMLRAALSSPPKAPEKIKFEERAKDLKKGFTVDDFKKDDLPKTEKKVEDESDESTKAPVKPKDDAATSVKANISKIADNFITYERTVNNLDLNKERLQALLLSIPVNTGVRREKPVMTFYFETLNTLSGDLARQAPEIAKLPVEKRVISDKLLDWHSNQVKKAVEAVDEANAQLNIEFQKKQEAYLEKKTRIFTYACVAGGAFGLFLVIIMLSIMVKIERNLRPLQQMVGNGRQTDSSGS